MELQLVNFDQAKALKELGFPQEDCEESYVVNEGAYDNSDYPSYMHIGDRVTTFGYSKNDIVSAPSLELAAKWLRDEKEIFIFPTLSTPSMTRWTPDKIYSYDYSIGGKLKINSKFCSSEYDDVLSAGIDRAIRILKLQ